MSILRARADAPDPVGELRLDAWARIPVRPGQTVTGALLCAGVLATSRSLKFRRPRGPFCLRGDCGTCLVTIGGRPSLRACMTRAAPGLEVGSQNRRDVGAWDPTDWIDTWLGRTFDPHHLAVRPRWANTWMKRVARRLSGLAEVPPTGDPRPVRTVEHQTTAVIIGAGLAGRAAAEAIATSTDDWVLLDRRRPGESVFGLYAEDEVVAAGSDGHEQEHLLQTWRCDHVILATGTRESLPLCPGNDLPGVVSARGLAELMDEEKLEPAGPVVVVGPQAHDGRWAQTFEGPFVALEEVAAIEGDQAVRSVLRRDGHRLPATLVATADVPSAASDLGRQAGAPTVWSNDGGFILERGPDGSCGSYGPWQLWACGSVCGVHGSEAAQRDGHRVGEAVAAAIRNRAPENGGSTR